jgi:hypothetical protein
MPSQAEPPVRIEQRRGKGLLEAYMQAVYEVSTPTAPLHLVVGQHAGLAPPRPGELHALLTACNPGSAPLSHQANVTRQAALEQALNALALDWRAAECRAVDGQWREPACWIPGVAPKLLDELAERFGQNASLTVCADGICRLRVHRDDWLERNLGDTRLQWPN